MALLIAGCILFLGSHLISVLGYRGKIEALGGAHAYEAIVTILSVISLVMIVLGYQRASYQQLWLPLPAAHELALYLMPVATILIVAGNIPGNIGRHVKHPMLTGIIVWALLHLLANGDLTSTIIFVTFGGYAIYRRFSLAAKLPEKQPAYRDGVAIIGGLGLYWLLYRFHGMLGGVGLT